MSQTSLRVFAEKVLEEKLLRKQYLSALKQGNPTQKNESLKKLLKVDCDVETLAYSILKEGNQGLRNEQPNGQRRYRSRASRSIQYTNE